MKSIENYYRQVAEIDWISTDEFSTKWLGKNKSYYRSIKARKMDASTKTLICLMESVKAQATRIGDREQGTLRSVAKRYEALAQDVGTEIARRALASDETSVWVRETLARIAEEVGNGAGRDYGCAPVLIF